MHNAGELSSPPRKDETESVWNSKLLQSKETRQRIEDNVLSLKNRIKFLQHEEDKLNAKIDATKVSLFSIKNFSRLGLKKSFRLRKMQMLTPAL